MPIRHWLAGTEMYDWAHETIAASQTDHIFDKVWSWRCSMSTATGSSTTAAGCGRS